MHRLNSAAIALLSAATLPGCDPQTDPALSARPAGPVAEPWFREGARAAGLEFHHSVARERHFYMPETVTGGVALLDYDADGDLDIYLVQGGDLEEPGNEEFQNALFRNEGNATFVDVTEESGVGDSGYGIGCAVGDFDSDGDPDLYVSNVGPNVLYRNEGDGTFSNVSESAGVADLNHGSSCGFGDVDGDGDLDLFVANYIQWSRETEIDCVLGSGARDYCSPKNYSASAPDVLYLNRGDGTFEDVTERAGLRTNFGNGLGVVFGDFNQDGSQDLYVANDGNPNQLWINVGDGRFTNHAVAWGCSVNMNGTAEAGMGIGVVDYDQDGDLDLFMTHLQAETNTFYENRGNYFKDITPLTGLSIPSRDFTGFGVGFCDFDHDGLLDLYVANGRVKHDARTYLDTDIYAEPNQLFRGVALGKFEELLPRGGTKEALYACSRGAAFGDLDNDGDIDIVVCNSNGPPSLLWNEVGVRGHWIQFRIANEIGAPAIGARVALELPSVTQFRTVQRAFSYCASNDPRIHYGLGAGREVPQVRVLWPDGVETTHGPFAADALHEIRR